MSDGQYRSHWSVNCSLTRTKILCGRTRNCHNRRGSQSSRDGPQVEHNRPYGLRGAQVPRAIPRNGPRSVGQGV